MARNSRSSSKAHFGEAEAAYETVWFLRIDASPSRVGGGRFESTGA